MPATALGTHRKNTMVALGLKNGGGNSRPGAVLGMKLKGGQSHALGNKVPGMFLGGVADSVISTVGGAADDVIGSVGGAASGVVDSARNTVEQAAANMAVDAVDKIAAGAPFPVPKRLKRKAKQIAAREARKVVRRAI